MQWPISLLLDWIPTDSRAADTGIYASQHGAGVQQGTRQWNHLHASRQNDCTLRTVGPYSRLDVSVRGAETPPIRESAGPPHRAISSTSGGTPRQMRGDSSKSIPVWQIAETSRRAA